MRARKCRARLKPAKDCWRVDETYITHRIPGQEGVDVPATGTGFDWCSSGVHAPALTLSPTRDVVSAKPFFRKALRARHTTPPHVINGDKNPSYCRVKCSASRLSRDYVVGTYLLQHYRLR